MKTLIISDIHGNADALRAVVDAEDAIDHTIFLGDELLAGPLADDMKEQCRKVAKQARA